MKKHIDIMGHRYSVMETGGNITLGDKENCLGAIDYAPRTIVIYKDMADEVKRETLIHEIAHAVLFHTGTANFFNDEQIEAICDIAPLIVKYTRGID